MTMNSPEEANSAVPTASIWTALLDGDPAPAVALFDALMDTDFGWAAGGLLRDVAERMHDADEYVEPNAKERFMAAALTVLSTCLDDDELVAELIAEAAEG